MQTILALLPLLVLLGLLVALRWTSARAGVTAWAVALALGFLSFGLNWDVLWVSQAKGFLLAVFVLSIFVPALYLYYLIADAGGIAALSHLLEAGIGDRRLLALVLSWCFSGLLEGLAGFGIPIAVIAPILVTLGLDPVLAVASVAVGHAWSVTFGDMGVVFQTLLTVTQMGASQLAGSTALLLGFACLTCGLGVALLLGQLNRWPILLVAGLAMSGVQFVFAWYGLAQLAAFGAGLAGILVFILYGAFLRRTVHAQSFQTGEDSSGAVGGRNKSHGRIAVLSVILGYGMLILLMFAVTLPSPLRDVLAPYVWQASFPSVQTAVGFMTPPADGPAFRLFLHPGTSLIFTALLCAVVLSSASWGKRDLWSNALRRTTKTALPAALGILATIEVAAIMEHTGMTILLAQELSQAAGEAFPVFSPWIGMLGAFASGSNNNSNVLFGMLQKNAAELLRVSPALLVAAQTTGGSLGSMIAPAKIAVGCSTVNISGKDGDVIRKTLPIGLVIGSVIGGIVLVLAHL